jgi:hypothetical protein
MTANVAGPEYIREMGCGHAMREATDKQLAPPLAVSSTGSPPSQWQPFADFIISIDLDCHTTLRISIQSYHRLNAEDCVWL